MFHTEAIVRGTQFRPIEAKAFVNSVEEGTILTLLREPSNPHDSNAIMILSPDPDAIHIGYVAKEIAVDVAPVMDEGRKLQARVNGRMSSSMITVEITEVDGADLSDQAAG
jgi:hypothetical protein